MLAGLTLRAIEVIMIPRQQSLPWELHFLGTIFRSQSEKNRLCSQDVVIYGGKP